MTNAEVEKAIKEFLLQEFLPGESPDALTSSTPLITGGILDSIGTLKLVSFLEESYGIRFDAYEVNAENLDSLGEIASIVSAKIAEK